MMMTMMVMMTTIVVTIIEVYDVDAASFEQGMIPSSFFLLLFHFFHF